jgi:hypothetical protein
LAHDELWAGVEVKLENATHHLDQMSQSLQEPPRTGHWVAMTGSSGGFGPNWHRHFYASLDAFLSATKSVGQIIMCCFGADDHPDLVPLSSLPAEQQDRRRKFQRQFKPHLDLFNALSLSKARNVSEHRTGYPPVTVATTGFFGVTYEGNPLKAIPTSEIRQFDAPNLPWVPSNPAPVRTNWQNFYIDGQRLFPACREYLNAAQALVAEARRLADQIHGDRELSPRW